jgi:CubicO group peptidase (beta-lactamase class C family)
VARTTALLFVLFTACVPSVIVGAEPEPVTGKGEARGRDVKPTRSTAPAEGDEASDPKDGSEALPTVDTTEIDPFFAEQMKSANIPGISVAVVGGGRLKWAKGYGLADVSARRKVTPDTVFMLASISKTVTAVALMQLIEDPARGLALDQPIDGKLPFSVRNPSFSTTPITYRMLLTHTSSLIDSDAYWDEQIDRPEGDATRSLREFEQAYVAQRDSWSRARPGADYEYSNTGVALAGLLVESISGVDLQTYCKAKIFDRLAMNETSWFLRGLDRTHIAMPYKGEDLAPQGFYGYSDYPDGQLRTSAPQLSRFLIMFAQNGEYKQQRILKSATVDEMKREQIGSLRPGQGLAWYTETHGGRETLGHNGLDDGVRTNMFFDPKTGSGYVLLMNGTETSSESIFDAAFEAMSDKLMELSQTLP